jgi:hypothetical protein
MSIFRWALAVGLIVVLPGTVSAVTVDQIVALSKAGVAESVILALIDRDKTVFTIEPEQLVKLQQEGAGESVIVAMLRSGRAEGDAQARADSAQKTETILSTLSTVPEVVLLGHGPDYPNVATHFYSIPAPLDLLPGPYALPYALPYATDSGGRRRVRRSMPALQPTQTSPTFCIAHPSSGPVPPAVGTMGFVTVCPPALQPQHRR